MAGRFAPWVQPIARQYLDTREVAIALANSLSKAELDWPIAGGEWTIADELSHIAASGADFLRVVEPLARGEQADTSVFDETDARNERNRQAWRARPFSDVVPALDYNGRDIVAHLAAFTDEDESRDPEELPFTLKELLEGYGWHGAHHVEQVRTARAERESTG